MIFKALGVAAFAAVAGVGVLGAPKNTVEADSSVAVPTEVAAASVEVASYTGVPEASPAVCKSTQFVCIAEPGSLEISRTYYRLAEVASDYSGVPLERIFELNDWSDRWAEPDPDKTLVIRVRESANS